MAAKNDPSCLRDVDAFLFDVFGTVVDWRGSVSKQLEAQHNGLLEIDWIEFTNEWRAGYMLATRRIASGGQGSTNIDVIHRELLDEMLASQKWEHLGRMWDDEKRKEINMVWHRLDGWPDSSDGLVALKKNAIVGTLSNGNVRLLVDMAKYANLQWDVVFSGGLLGSYKPNPKVYLGAVDQLSSTPSKCVMVAAHMDDLVAAASHGMKTAYIRRLSEDHALRDSVKSKAEGGEVDVVVDSILELAELCKIAKEA